MTQYLNPPGILGNQNAPRFLSLNDTVSAYSAVIAANYLGALQALGHVFYATDMIYVQYVGGNGWFNVYLDTNNIATLTPAVGRILTQNVTFTAAQLATAGHGLINPSVGSQQFQVVDVKVIYRAAGLSGGGGDRLLQITDGTTVYNNAGITAALLGTPINTVWGGSGNPLPGTVAMNTLTAAGASLYAVYAGGTTDWTTGSVSLAVSLQRAA